MLGISECFRNYETSSTHHQRMKSVQHVKTSIVKLMTENIRVNQSKANILSRFTF